MEKLPSDIWLDAIQPYLTKSDRVSMLLTRRSTQSYVDALVAPSYQNVHRNVIAHHGHLREWADTVETYATCIGWTIVIATGLITMPSTIVPTHIVHILKWAVCLIACPLWWYLIRRVEYAHRLAIARPKDWKPSNGDTNGNAMTARCIDYIERRDSTGYLYPMLAMAIARCWYLLLEAIHIILQYWFLCCSSEHSAGGDGALLPIMHRHRHNRAGVGRRRKECAATVRNTIMLVYSIAWPLTFLTLVLPMSIGHDSNDGSVSMITTLELVERHTTDVVAMCFTVGAFVACLGAHVWVMYDLNRAATEARHHDDFW
jgi:hypothetical protein